MGDTKLELTCKSEKFPGKYKLMSASDSLLLLTHEEGNTLTIITEGVHGLILEEEQG